MYMTRTGQTGVLNATPPPLFLPTAVQSVTQTELWQLDPLKSCGKLVETTFIVPPNETTIGAYTIALLGEDVLVPGTYAWAVVVRNAAAWFDSEKPVEWQVLTRSPDPATFLLLYSDDVSEAMADAGLFDTPDDSYNAVLPTYQGTGCV